MTLGSLKSKSEMRYFATLLISLMGGQVSASDEGCGVVG